MGSCGSINPTRIHMGRQLTDSLENPTHLAQMQKITFEAHGRRECKEAQKKTQRQINAQALTLTHPIQRTHSDR